MIASTCTLNAEAKQPYVFYQAPASAGSYTVTATSEADKAQSVAVKVNVYKAPVELSVVPHALTLYKGQYAISAVDADGIGQHRGALGVDEKSWGRGEVAGRGDGPGDRVFGERGRHLCAYGDLGGGPEQEIHRDAVRDRSCDAGAAAPNRTMPVDCTPTGKGKTYDVGKPGSNYKKLADVSWDSLKAGDTVRIWAAGGPYHEGITSRIRFGDGAGAGMRGSRTKRAIFRCWTARMRSG